MCKVAPAGQVSVTPSRIVKGRFTTRDLGWAQDVRKITDYEKCLYKTYLVVSIALMGFSSWFFFINNREILLGEDVDRTYSIIGGIFTEIAIPVVGLSVSSITSMLFSSKFLNNLPSRVLANPSSYGSTEALPV
jgi:hypothetical protein